MANQEKNLPDCVFVKDKLVKLKNKCYKTEIPLESICNNDIVEYYLKSFIYGINDKVSKERPNIFVINEEIINIDQIDFF